MEDQIKKLKEDELNEINKLKAEREFKEKLIEEQKKLKIAKKKNETRKKEENSLKNKLEDLRKENFSLETSVSAWQITLEKKIEDLKLAEMKLNDLYREIWSEREKFCSYTDTFNNTYGISSNWWKIQLKSISSLEKLGQKESNDKCKEEIETLKKEIEALRVEIEVTLKQKNPLKDTVHNLTEMEVSNIAGNQLLETLCEKSNNSENLFAEKNSNLSENEDVIEIFSKELTPPNILFSIMEPKKIKIVKKNIRRENAVIKHMKKLSKK